jgi:peptide/nickel transport system ATP-binding protein
MSEESAAPLLSISGLAVEYRRGNEHRTILSGVDLELAAGRTIGVVGESGSGKSMTAKAVMRLLPPRVQASGVIRYDGHDLGSRTTRQMAALRGAEMSLLYQDPFSMLNPLLRCGDHIAEGLVLGQKRRSRTQEREEVLRRLVEVGIRDADVADRYPFQLSGGMRQRVALAAALARDPRLLIADEPTTALDVTTQAEILDLLSSLQRSRGMSLMLITHDLRVAFSVCDQVYVVYAGRVLEVGDAQEVQSDPLHPYTQGLLLSEPPVDRRAGDLVSIEGSVPSPDDVTLSCAFAPRCAWATDICRSGRPALATVDAGRQSACVRINEIRPEMVTARGRIYTAVAPPLIEPAPASEPLMSIRDVTKVFGARGKREASVPALRGVTLHVGAKESVGLVGESGSGKTTLGRCVVGLETPTDGSLIVDGMDAHDYGAVARDIRAKLRRSAQMVFQDPYSSLDPRQTIGSMLRETLAVNGRVEPNISELLRLVGLPDSYADQLPRALSGGERQRAAIARSLAVGPKLLVCDEPVSALDVSVQAQILNLFAELRERLGLSYLFITHDLAVVRQVVDRVYVMYRGEIVEEGPVDRVLDDPQHPYTRRLIESIPKIEQEA